MYDNELVKILMEGGVAVMSTDTLYGIVCQAENKFSVDRVYKLRKRSPSKPCIILISDINDLQNFSVNLSEMQEIELKKYWPGRVSVVLDCDNNNLEYLHRGTRTLAFRLPELPALVDLIKQTGPLIAPSANLEGLPPAKNIDEAKKYFRDEVDLYVDGGEISGEASKVIKLHKDGRVDILRA